MKIHDFFKKDGFTVDWERIESIPCFADMKTCLQSNVWHNEGNVMNHTKLVVEEMCKRMKELHPYVNMYYKIMVVSALCHDLGKVPTTYWDYKKQDYVTENHGRHGEKITRTLLFDEDVIYREMVCWMVRWHMDFHHLLMKDEEKIKKRLITLSYGHMNIEDMLILNLCDSKGSINEVETDEMLEDRYNRIKGYAEELGCLKSHYKFKNHLEKYRFFTDKEYEGIPEKGEESLAEGYDFNVYVLLGLPGSGKSTYVEELKKSNKDIVVISRDIIRIEMGLKGEKPMGNKKQEDNVTEIFNEKLLECCKNKMNCVLDNTNLCKKYRDTYTDMIMEYNPNIIYVYIEPDSIETCKKRREGMMPLDVIDRMYNYMEFPTYAEYDGLMVKRNNIEEDD